MRPIVFAVPTLLFPPLYALSLVQKPVATSEHGYPIAVQKTASKDRKVHGKFLHITGIAYST